jgi:hypothetical protein
MELMDEEDEAVRRLLGFFEETGLLTVGGTEAIVC